MDEISGDGKRKQKRRPIRFSSRRDAAIYARYRVLLAEFYEAELAKRGLSNVPVAYRRIPRSDGLANKSSIDFAKDAFDFIRRNKNCIATVVDIKSYFESLDHALITQKWEMLIGAKLPPDHEAVLKSVTRYSVVDVESAFDRLELRKLGEGRNRREKRQRRLDKLRAKSHMQICSPQDFRKFICGGDPKYPSLIQKNNLKFGTPQGLPISDVIANFYLIDFDETVFAWVERRGGFYARYSDDIIVIVPDEGDPLEVKEYLQKQIRTQGEKLVIQDKKVAVGRFKDNGQTIQYENVFGAASKNGLEYLGFEFDGSFVRIKNASLANAWRRLKRKAYGFSRRYVSHYRNKGAHWLVKNFPAKALETRFLRVVTFSQDNGFESWTFQKYVTRSSKTFVDYNRQFSGQTKRYRRMTSAVVSGAFNKALRIHGDVR